MYLSWSLTIHINFDPMTKTKSSAAVCGFKSQKAPEFLVLLFFYNYNFQSNTLFSTIFNGFDFGSRYNSNEDTFLISGHSP